MQLVDDPQHAMHAQTGRLRHPAQAPISREEHPISDMPGCDETEAVIWRKPRIPLCKPHSLPNEFGREFERFKAAVVKLPPVPFREVQHLGVANR